MDIKATLLLTTLLLNAYAVERRVRIPKQPRRRRRWAVRPANKRENWVKGQYSYFLNLKENDPEEFFKYTRMSVKTFNELLSRINFRKRRRNSICPEMKLALTLQYLSQGSSMRKDGWGFEIGLTTVSLVLPEVCRAIIDTLMPTYLPKPTKSDWFRIARGFEEQWNMPNCIGAVDGKHIMIQAPKKSGSQYFNYKHSFSLVLMAIVDANYRFSIVDIGAYGSQSDGGIFEETSFGQALLNDRLGQDLQVPEDRMIPGVGLTPYFLVGDAAFPLKRNLMKPFPGKGLPEVQETFNYRLSRSRRIVENGFGILAARWRIFRTVIAASPEKAEIFALACVCLHNFIMSCEDSKKYNPPGFADHEDPDGNLIHGAYREENRNSMLSPMPQVGARNAKREAYQVRDRLAEYFIKDGRVPWQAKHVHRGKLANNNRSSQ